jgi:hypothetical protein
LLNFSLFLIAARAARVRINSNAQFRIMYIMSNHESIAESLA